MPAKQYFQMRRIPPIRRRIAADYAQFTRALVSGELATWSITAAKLPKYQKNNLDVKSFGLSRCFRQRVRCGVHYTVVGKDDPDNQSSDDAFYITFAPDQNSYRDFIDSFVPTAIEAFSPYRAELGPDALIDCDFEVQRQTNQRYDAYRLFPVDYFSCDLVKSAFGVSLAKFKAAAKSFYESVEDLHQGVLLANRSPYTVEQCDELSESLMSKLGRKQSRRTSR